MALVFIKNQRTVRARDAYKHVSPPPHTHMHLSPRFYICNETLDGVVRCRSFEVQIEVLIML